MISIRHISKFSGLSIMGFLSKLYATLYRCKRIYRGKLRKFFDTFQKSFFKLFSICFIKNFDNVSPKVLDALFFFRGSKYFSFSSSGHIFALRPEYRVQGEKLVGPRRVGLLTFAMSMQRSNQLSYEPTF